MASRIVELMVALAALLSAAMLALMLVGPILPQPAAADPEAASGSGSPSPSASAAPEPRQPPIGLFQLRGPLQLGVCLGLELEERAYPEDGRGQATVLWWERGTADTGNPEACATRGGDVNRASATVEPERPADAAPTDDPIAYHVRFGLDGAASVPDARIDVIILLRQSTDALLQATAVGEGLVFDRVESIDPPPGPLASAPPVAAFEPVGSFLLDGPLPAGGPCLVIELDEASYPPDAATFGAASVRWWPREGARPGEAADCLQRSGEIGAGSASVRARGPVDAPDDYFVVLPPEAVGGGELSIRIQAAESTVDRLIGFVATDGGEVPLSFTRVDAIDPQLASAPPSGSP